MVLLGQDHTDYLEKRRALWEMIHLVAIPMRALCPFWPEHSADYRGVLGQG